MAGSTGDRWAGNDSFGQYVFVFFTDIGYESLINLMLKDLFKLLVSCVSEPAETISRVGCSCIRSDAGWNKSLTLGLLLNVEVNEQNLIHFMKSGPSRRSVYPRVSCLSADRCSGMQFYCVFFCLLFPLRYVLVTVGPVFTEEMWRLACCALQDAFSATLEPVKV